MVDGCASMLAAAEVEAKAEVVVDEDIVWNAVVVVQGNCGDHFGPSTAQYIAQLDPIQLATSNSVQSRLP